MLTKFRICISFFCTFIHVINERQEQAGHICSLSSALNYKPSLIYFWCRFIPVICIWIRIHNDKRLYLRLFSKLRSPHLNIYMYELLSNLFNMTFFDPVLTPAQCTLTYRAVPNLRELRILLSLINSRYLESTSNISRAILAPLAVCAHFSVNLSKFSICYQRGTD